MGIELPQTNQGSPELGGVDAGQDSSPVDIAIASGEHRRGLDNMILAARLDRASSGLSNEAAGWTYKPSADNFPSAYPDGHEPRPYGPVVPLDFAVLVAGAATRRNTSQGTG